MKSATGNDLYSKDPRWTLFENKALEDDYVVYLRESFTKNNLLLHRVAMVSGLLMACASAVTSSEKTVIVDVMVNLLITISFAVLRYTFTSDYMVSGNNAEKWTWAAITFTLAVWITLSFLDVYSSPSDKCFEDTKTLKEAEKCAWLWAKTMMSHTTGVLICMFSLLWTQLVRMHYVRLFILVQVCALTVRAFVLTPYPPEGSPLLVAYSILVSPLVFHSVATHLDGHLRRVFQLQREMQQHNATLKAKLDEAERAIQFDLPTPEEKKIVHGVVAEAGSPLLSDIEIPFKDLDLLNRIGIGSFGEVLKAEYNGKTVAVKRLVRSRIKKTVMTSFMEEVAIHLMLHHPNIVQFFGASWDSIVNICIVCEFVERGDLTGVLTNPEMRLTWQDPQLRMMMDITSGLAFMHSRDPPILHRDLKPDNVLVTTAFTCKLTDFGVSRVKSDQTMTLIGTVHYMAPEVISHGHYSQKVDVYGLGMILLQMESRQKLPKGSKGREAAISDAVNGIRPPFPPSMPPALRQLTQECWAHDPDQRPTAEQVRIRLGEIQMRMWDIGGEGGGGGGGGGGGRGGGEREAGAGAGGGGGGGVNWWWGGGGWGGGDGGGRGGDGGASGLGAY